MIGYSYFISKITTSIKDSNFNLNTIYTSMLCIISIILASQLVYIIKNYIEIYMMNNLVFLIRNNIFVDILNKISGNYQQIEKGKIISYLDIIPQIYEEKVYEFLNNLMPHTLTILVFNIYFYFVDFKLGLYVSLMVIVLIFFIHRFSKKCTIKKIDKQQKYYENNENIQDKLSNIFSILVSNKYNSEIQKNRKKELDYKYKKLSSDKENLSADIRLVCIVIVFTIIILLYYIQIFKKKYKVEMAITSFLVFFSLIDYLNEVHWYYINFFNNNALIEQYRVYIKNDINLIDGTKTNFITKGEFKLNNIVLNYNKRKIFQNLNIEFKSNKLNIVIGSSGSGKSSMFRLLLRLIDPTSGIIYLDGVDLKESKMSYLRDNISIVNQNTFLFNTTIYENIRYINNNITEREINDFIEESGLKKNIFTNIELNMNVGVDGNNLSNGQRQLILILREYFSNKKILLMDEPTASLDVKTKEICIDFIKKICKYRTVIVSTHDVYLKDKGDKIYKLD